MEQVQALVIGAGPSGLAAAYALQGKTLVLEKENTVGGLCRSIRHEGGVFDIGGHSFHTPYPEVYELVQELLDGELFLQQRDARIFSHGTLIPYPFQKYYDQLPNASIVRSCEEGLRTKSGDPGAATNFEEYILRKFGIGIAEHFMLPYNRKLWARDIRTISCEWVSERVAAPKGENEKFDTTGGQRTPLQADTCVGYPPQGGFEELYRSFVPHIPQLKLNTDVVHIDPQAHITTTADGNQYQWDFLISTMPLPILMRMVEGTPSNIIAQADQLEYMSLRVELLLTARPVVSPIQRIYVASPDIPPHKIALNHNSSDYLRQQPRHAIMAEVSLSEQKPVNVNEITPKTIDFLVDCGVLASANDITWQGHIDVKYAYPVYTHARPMLLETIKAWLEQHDIYTLGRFGDWEYINSDKCVMKALKLGQWLRQRYPQR